MTKLQRARRPPGSSNALKASSADGARYIPDAHPAINGQYRARLQKHGLPLDQLGQHHGNVSIHIHNYEGKRRNYEGLHVSAAVGSFFVGVGSLVVTLLMCGG